MGQDINALNSHISENHQNPEKSIDSPKVVPDLVVHKRIVQNFKGIDFEDDSDDDIVWTPTKSCSEAEIFYSLALILDSIINDLTNDKCRELSYIPVCV